MEFTIDRTAVVANAVRTMLDSVDEQRAAEGYIHLFGVAKCCVLLAKKRGLDCELAYIMGLLHDYSYYLTGDREEHARKSGDMILPLLAKTELFVICEMGTIAKAIASHSDKNKTDGNPYEELLKDGDVLDRMLMSPGSEQKEIHKARAEKLTQELF